MKRAALMVGLSLVLILGMSNPGVSAEAEYAAMIMDMQNGAAVYASGLLEGEPVEIGGFLNASDEINIPEGIKLVLTYFATSKREEIQGPTKIVITPTQSKPLEAGSAAIKQEKIAYVPPKSNIENIHARTFGNIAFRSVSPGSKPNIGLPVLSLLNTKLIAGAPVELRWRKMGEVQEYVAKLFDENDKLVQEIKTTHNRAAFKNENLKPGEFYHWSLEAMKKGESVEKATGEFKILSTAETNTLKTVKENIQKRFPDDSIEGLLSLNLLYQGHGLHDNAVTVLLKLHKMHPQNSVVVNQLNNLNPAILAAN